MDDFFEVLGLPRQFNLEPERVESKFLAASRTHHPDIPAPKSDCETVDFGLYNRARRVLQDPLGRVRHWLELEDVATDARSHSVNSLEIGRWEQIDLLVAACRQWHAQCPRKKSELALALARSKAGPLLAQLKELRGELKQEEENQLEVLGQLEHLSKQDIRESLVGWHHRMVFLRRCRDVLDQQIFEIEKRMASFS